MATVTVKVDIDPAAAHVALSHVLIRGGDYVLAFNPEDAGTILTLISCSGEVVAQSEADGTLSLTSTALADAFAGTNPQHGTAMQFHVFASLSGTTLGTGSAYVLNSPIHYTATLLPATLKGDKGAEGKSAYLSWLEIPGNEGKTEAEFVAWMKGVKGDKGDPGENGAYIPMGGMYAFSVTDDGNLLIRAQDGSQLFAVDENGETDYGLPLFAITDAGHLAYTFYDNGLPVQVVDLGRVVGAQGAALTWNDLTEAQKASLKGEPGADGADGLTEQDVRGVVESYGYITDAALEPLATQSSVTALGQAVDQKLEGKQAVLTFDPAPQAGSGGVLTSGAIKSMEETLNARIDAMKGVQMDEVKALLAQIMGSVAETVPSGFDAMRSTLQGVVSALKGGG